MLDNEKKDEFSPPSFVTIIYILISFTFSVAFSLYVITEEKNKCRKRLDKLDSAMHTIDNRLNEVEILISDNMIKVNKLRTFIHGPETE